jgi:putative CocE/NonD family hydrolase
VTWASSREWSNGRVGTVGTSYLAAIQWLVAVEKPEGLAAIIPWEGFTDLYRDVLFHGGIPETAFVQSWLAGPGGIIGSDDDPEYLARRPFARYLPLP